jgi:dTDP-D-glucose 4,6-dehydratase
MGVRGRNSDNRLIREKLRWAPSRSLREGLRKTYDWISGEVEKANGAALVAAGDPASAVLLETASK